MALSKEALKKRKELASDLRKMATILDKYFPNAEIGNIGSAISDLYNTERIPQIPNKTSDGNLWGYSLNRLIFKFDKPPCHTIPDKCKDLKLILDITAIGDCVKSDKLDDPLKWLEFNIVIEGTKFEGTKKKQLLTSYHLDRHIFNESDGEPEHPHPLYHFQFGGRKLTKENESLETGNLLVLDSPRIAHYPMEAILGIDFTLSNFFSLTWKKMRSESPEYNNLLEKYQEIILKPYIHTHSNHWKYSENSLMINEFWSPLAICPQLS